MIIQEKIKKEAEGYGKLAPAFIEGAKFALENQWINVKDDLPCNHEEMIQSNFTDTVLVLSNNGGHVVEVTSMCFIEDAWKWNTLATVLYWMPIPELPKE